MKTKFKKISLFVKKDKLGFMSLVFGIFLLIVFSFWRAHQLRVLSFNTRELSGVFASSGISPVYIKIYPVGVDVDVKQTSIINGVWAIQPQSASHLVSSAGIGDKGNMIIYGHNKDNILGPIRHIALGAKIEIKGSDGNTYFYEVVRTDIVDPDYLEYILPKEEEILTLYTCTGFMDLKRFIVIAKRSV